MTSAVYDEKNRIKKQILFEKTPFYSTSNASETLVKIMKKDIDKQNQKLEYTEKCDENSARK